MPLGVKLKISRTMAESFTSSIVPVPNESTMMETGSTTPMA